MRETLETVSSATPTAAYCFAPPRRQMSPIEAPSGAEFVILPRPRRCSTRMRNSAAHSAAPIGSGSDFKSAPLRFTDKNDAHSIYHRDYTK